MVTGPNDENIRKVDNFLKLVTSDKRFKVVTAGELWQLFQKNPQEFQGPSFVPYTGMWLTYLKAWRYFFGHSILNKIVAIAPIAFVVGLLTAVAYLLRMRQAKRRWQARRTYKQCSRYKLLLMAGDVLLTVFHIEKKSLYPFSRKENAIRERKWFRISQHGPNQKTAYFASQTPYDPFVL